MKDYYKRDYYKIVSSKTNEDNDSLQFTREVFDEESGTWKSEKFNRVRKTQLIGNE